MTKFSEHFSEQEFLFSHTALKNRINNNWQQESHRSNAILLCKNYLEEIRIIVGKPIIITSGYRVPQLNKLIGGAVTSEHIEGTAVDFYVVGQDIRDTFELILERTDLMIFNQLILENGWIHLGIGGTNKEIWSTHPDYNYVKKIEELNLKTVNENLKILEKRLDILEKEIEKLNAK